MNNTNYQKAKESILHFTKVSIDDKSAYTQKSIRQRLMKSLDELYGLGFKIYLSRMNFRDY